MKNIFKFFGAFLTVALSAALTGCMPEEQLETADLGLHIKVFSPTKVVAGQPMTINGYGFSDVTEIVFPDSVVVKDFQIVSNDMIRVNAPKGIKAEGGKIIVSTEAGETAESPLDLILGQTKISGYSVEAGAEIEGGSQIKIFGTDLEFITGVELLDADGNPALISDKFFNKKGTDCIIFTVPKKVYEGAFVGKVYTIDGKTLEMPEFEYKPAPDGGYWETVETIIWENDGSVGAANWDATYRFAMEGMDALGECVAEIPADIWEKMKTTPFNVQITPAADWWQVRLLDGHWSIGNAESNDISPNTPDKLVDNGDGTFTFVVDLQAYPAEGDKLVTTVDEKHFLMSGSGFIVNKMFFTEDVWVEGGTVEIVRTSIWKNDGSVGAASWSAHIYRFGMEGADANNECIATIAPEVWEKMKTTPFKVQIQSAADWWQVRILDGHWSIGNAESNDISPNTPDKFVDNGDGTFTFEVDLQTYPDTDNPLVTTVDEKHLLFAGADFIILEMYWEEEVLVPGGGKPTEVVLWEGEAIAEDWANQPNILSDAGVELQEAGAQPGQTIYLYMEPIDPSQHWYLELVEGHWNGTTYRTLCAVDADTQDKFAEYDLDANEGKAALEVTQEMLDVAYVQQWWGGTFIANGDNLKITKVTLL